MTMCNAEIIKKIKELEERKQEILLNERMNSTSAYQTEADKIETGYDFQTTRKAVAELNDEIRKLKHALNVANSTVIVDEFGMTVGECLILMAQLNNEKAELERMARAVPKSRHTVFNGTVEYIETNYDVGVCKSCLEMVKSNVIKLQLAIDRINLNNMIEV
jgi:hypothetical protein